MKHTIALTLFLAQCFLLSGQSDTISLAESFSARAGTLIEKQYVDVGVIRGIQVRVLKLKDIGAGKSVSALRFEYEEVKTYTTTTKISVLDSDEVDGAVTAIGAMLQAVYHTKRDVYTEIIYRNRSGFSCGAYFDLKKQDWQCFVSIGKYGAASIYMTKEEAAKVLGYIEKGKTMM
jgi:hypothetical protein